jgi:hypothetical protein
MEHRAIAAGVAPKIRAGTVQLKTIGLKAANLDRHVTPKPKLVILAGLAGGLSPALAIGEVIAQRSANWPRNDLPVRLGAIHTADHVVCTVEEKGRLFEQTRCDAVDMEGSIVSQWAESRGLPMLHIRAISDSADHAIPPEILSLVDPTGRPRPGKIAANIAFRPRQIPTMIRLGKNSRLALRNLTDAIRRIVEDPANS